MNNVSIKGAKITACCIKQIPFAWYVKHTSKMTAFDIANKKGEVRGLALWYPADQSSDVSAFLRRCLRLISPSNEATINCAVLSPGSFNASISSINSCGARACNFWDFAFFVPVAITDSPCNRWSTVYAFSLHCKSLTWTPPLTYSGVHLACCKILSSDAPKCGNTIEASYHNVNGDTGGTINQTNHYNITAGGVDADGLVRRIKQEQSEDIHQALNMTKTDKF